MKKADILLVDDEVVFTTNMSRLLTSRGYQVTSVKNGEEAIAALKEKPFDVMVLDLKMPVMDGITTLQQMKAIASAARQSRFWTRLTLKEERSEQRSTKANESVCVPNRKSRYTEYIPT